MIQMIDNGVTVDKFTWTTKMVKPRANIRIFATPSNIGLVEAINCNEVLAPNCHIAANQTPLFGPSANYRRRQTNGFERPVHSGEKQPLPNRGSCRIEILDVFAFHKAPPP